MPATVALSRFEDLIARGLTALIDDDPNLQVVAEDLDPDGLQAVLGERQPDVALLNYGSLRTPFEVHELHSAHPGTRLVVLASRPTAAEANQMLTFGATACLSKETQARDVLNAIHLASRGLQVLPRARPADAALASSGPEPLTARESDVLALLQDGRSNAEIALALQVGVETVRTHARNIYRKLGVRTRRELADR
ncbi:response regulator transcription factor [Capillimicrobium parvum]|uniref:Transcriptional regulatory protein DegU n=1 Tax=Capillimicrobium parvum TaxID=2884022 RepID=A0A9E6XUA2_9ACTN|nr:response regulator transcription factor [Capillimicrobium parvum]UGS34563.1 Transcriptional regulatory protein DegU [Capillimicrobium parvum]